MFEEKSLHVQEHGNLERQISDKSSAQVGTLAFLQDKGAISACSADSTELVASGINSMLICQAPALGGNDSHVMLVLLSDRPRAWSRRERLWGLAITKKLGSCMS